MSEKRGNLYSYDPTTDVGIIGGNTLNASERGEHDTDIDVNHPLHDNRLIEEPELDDGFVRNVDAFGVITPIRCRKYNGVPFVVVGRRRLRAARRVNREREAKGEPPMRIDVVLEASGNELRLMGSLITENSNRRDDGFRATMEKLQRVMSRGVSIDDAAVMFGERPNVLASWIAFDEHAVDDLKALVHAGRMSVSAGIEIQRLGDPALQAAALGTLVTPELLVDVDGAASAPVAPTKITARAARTAAKTAKRGADVAVGCDDKRTQRRLLQAIQDKSHGRSEKTIAFWEGAENMLALVLGDEEDGKPAADPRLVEILAEVRKQMKKSK